MEFANKIGNTKLTNGLCCSLLVLAAILVFYNSLQNEFVYDDHFVVVQNDQIRTLDALDFLTTEYWAGFKKEGMGTYYRPITILTFALDYALWELDPYGYHLTNLLIHAMAAVLLFLLLIRIKAPILVALSSALLFAVHPVHTEAVANISGRSDLLLTFFALVSFLFYTGKGKSQLFGTAPALLLALLCKESALVLPAVFVLYDFIFRANEGTGVWEVFKARFRSHHLWLWASVGLFMILRAIAVGNLLPVSPSPLDNPLVDAPLSHRLMTMPVIVLHYLRLLAFPATLSVDYSFNQIPVISSPIDASFLIGLFVVISALWGIFKIWHRSPLGAFAAGLLVIPLLLNLNPFVPSGTMLAERYLYLPSAGFCLLIGLAYQQLRTRVRRPEHKALFALLAATLVISCGLRTVSRNQEWRSDETLFKSATVSTPNSVRAHLNLAFLLKNRGDDKGAVQHYRRILAIKANYPIVNYNLAESYRGMRENENALYYYEQAARHRPAFVEAWTSLGNMYLHLGKELEAESAFEVALNLSPDLSFVHNQIGVIRQRKGDFASARQSYQRAIQGNYRKPGVFCNLGVAYANEGRKEEARRSYLQALSLRPDLAIAHYHLGNLYRDQGHKASALDHYRAFLRYWKEDPQYIEIVKQSIKALDTST